MDPNSTYPANDMQMLFAYAEMNLWLSAVSDLDCTEDPIEALSTLMRFARKRLPTGRHAVEMVPNLRVRKVMTDLDSVRNLMCNITANPLVVCGSAGLTVASMIMVAHDGATICEGVRNFV